MTSQIEKGPEGVEKLFPNVDRWGAAEWFERLVNAVAKRDEAVLSKDDGSFEIYNNIASSSASVLAREHAPDIRRALTATGESKTDEGNEPITVWINKRSIDELLASERAAGVKTVVWRAGHAIGKKHSPRLPFKGMLKCE